MQGWYAEYCANTGQFCDQVKLKHSTKDKSGAELVYHVGSSANYHPEDEMIHDDIETSYQDIYSTTTMPTTTTTAFKQPTKTVSKAFNFRNVKDRSRDKLIEEMRKIFSDISNSETTTNPQPTVETSTNYNKIYYLDYNDLQDFDETKYWATSTTTKASKVLGKRNQLVEKMRNMFHKLGEKYMTQKLKAEEASEESTTTSTSTTLKPVDFNTSPAENNLYDEFSDFVPMEYEVVEDIVIENV